MYGVVNYQPAQIQPKPAIFGIGKAGLEECAAVYVPIDSIKTDPKRFQNRKNAFSEVSAEAVANRYDPNKLDPIIVWEDPKNKQIYVLSGHSRYEGLKRRGEQLVPVRYFEGTEAQAIEFSRVDANRAATPETITEDIAAYRLMRDGDPSKGIKPATKSELKNKFKGRDNKLEAYSYLTPNGKFMVGLSNEDRSQFPHIELRAQWTGVLRKEHGSQLTDLHERDIFDWLYSENGGLKLNRDEFRKIIKDRLAMNSERLFPECKDGVCASVKDTEELFASKAKKEIYNQIREVNRNLDIIKQRFDITRPDGARVHTEPEKEVLRKIYDREEKQLKALQKQLGQEIVEQGLFGVRVTGIAGIGRACGSGCNSPNLQAMQEAANKGIAKTTKCWNINWTHQQGRTIDIIAEIQATFADAPQQTANFAKHLQGATFENTLYNVWFFTRAFIKYRVDPPGIQYVKTPARTWQDKYGDCKSYSIMIASILSNLGIKCAFRFVSYPESNGEYSHVYVIVPNNQTTGDITQGYYTLDACLPTFNDEKPYVTKLDQMTKIARVSGIGISQTDELTQALNALQTPGITAGQLELQLAKAQIEAEQSRIAGLYGPNNPRAEMLEDTKEMLDDMIRANGDQATLDAIEAEYIAGSYNVAGLIAGIGAIDPTQRTSIRSNWKTARKQRIKRMCNCRKLMQTPNAARSQMMQDVQALPSELQPAARMQVENLPVEAVLSGILSISDSDYADTFDADDIAVLGIGRRPKKKKGFLKQVGRGVKKAGQGVAKGAKKTFKVAKNVAKKTVKAVQRVVTTPIRVLLEGVLRTKAANWFLYTFLTEEQAQKAPAKVQQKRSKQIKLAKFITDATTMKESHFKKLLRIGIKKANKGREPEEVIKGLISGQKISGFEGIGAFPVVLIAPIIKLVEGIAKTLKKKGPKPDAADGPDPSDWGNITDANAEVAESLDDNPGQIRPTGLMDNDDDMQPAGKTETKMNTTTMLLIGAGGLAAILLLKK